jgi:hypothetical protein
MVVRGCSVPSWGGTPGGGQVGPVQAGCWQASAVEGVDPGGRGKGPVGVGLKYAVQIGAGGGRIGHPGCSPGGPGCG